MLLNNAKSQNDERFKNYINPLLDNLDKRAVDSKHPKSIYEISSNLIIDKNKSRYVVRNSLGKVLLSTTDRKEVENMIYSMIE